MPHHLTQSEYDEMLSLRDSGWTIRELQDRFNRSYYGVWKTLKEVNRNNLPTIRAIRKIPMTHQNIPTFQELKLSSLPDNILFKHVNYPIP